MNSLRRQLLTELWEQAVTPLRKRLSAEDFDTWIRPLRPVRLDGSTVEVEVPNRMFATWIEEHFLEELSAAWLASAGRRVRFRFTEPSAEPLQGELFGPEVLGPSPQPSLFDAPANQHGGLRRRSAPGGLIPSYRFANFVVGANNQFARAAAIAVSEKPGCLYNPFLVFGGIGLGKTHLVNAIGNAIVQRDGDTRVLFITADAFTNRLIDAISRNRVQDFKQRMRRVDVLILDDVQCLAGRERTQEEFFHLFNALHDEGKQIVLTCDTFPNDIDGLEERLCNRFSWGLVADIKPPDLETRIAIVERKAREEGIKLPVDVATLIATEIDSNVRDLEAALTRLSAWASIHRREITIDLAREVLGSGRSQKPSRPTAEQVEARVVSHFGLKPGDLKARRRTKKLAEARHVAMYLMRNYAGMSFPAIGEYLGGRDHSTVIHGCQAVERRCREDQTYRGMIATLARLLERG
ncbi:MAG: chromosomal replication initiator protein DnaA [Candidatus Dadabacteria bacterium]|nr:MAG: chromosomal replication initiator protein DnaA [Candidatus Dadabacteria bacterium]